jgi:transposase-like protein
MTEAQGKLSVVAAQELLKGNPDGLREVVRAVLQEVLEAEMTDTLAAAKGERSSGRLGYRSGYYGRTLITRVGKLELRVPQDRDGRFSTELFERYQRSEQALVASLAEMGACPPAGKPDRGVQGVSTRKVKAVTEELCGHAFSASAISAVDKRLDESLAAFARRRLEEPFAHLILDARHEKVREAGVVRSRAVLIAVGIDCDGRRQVLAVELANRESRSAWKDFLLGLKERGLFGVEFVVADDHAGLKAALREVLPDAFVQRCYVHFLRNALDHLPRKADDDCLQELRWIYDRRELAEAKTDLAAWLKKWSPRYPKLTEWVEESIEETFTYYRLPRQHHKHMKSTNMLERLNEEIKRRTYVVRIFPNAESCLRLVRALAVETHENWLEANRYLNMDDLKEQKKRQLREAA